MQPVNLKDYIQINKRHWDAIAVRNWAQKKAELPDIVRDPDSYLKRVEPYLYPYLRDVKGKLAS